MNACNKEQLIIQAICFAQSPNGVMLITDWSERWRLRRDEGDRWNVTTYPKGRWWFIAPPAERVHLKRKSAVSSLLKVARTQCSWHIFIYFIL